jgi:VWFA-related protein
MRAVVSSCNIGVLIACLMGGAMLCAQQPPGIQGENGVYTLHEDTHLILLDVTVTNFVGHPVAGLAKDDFKLLEDGQPQTIKFFEEHAPVDPAEIARQKAVALANRPPNTFTNDEPSTGRPVTVLVLNLLTLPSNMNGGAYGLYVDMLDTLQKSPPDTPFAIYVLDSELRLVQPITTDHALLLAKIQNIGDEMEHLKSPRSCNLA